MTDQVVWSGDTRTEVSKLIISTNELTSKVITLLNAISGNFDGLVGQLEEATSAVNGGVADLSNIKADIESSIRRAQEDMGNIYKSFLTDSTDIKSTLSGLSTDAEEVKLILVTLDNTSKVLSDKYAKLNSTAEEVGTYVLLYKNQASTIQESILGLEARAATISANLDRVSEMAQLNTESSEEFMQQLSTMKVDVYNLSASVSEYTDLAKELVDSYSRLTQVATEASTTATAAYNDAVNAMDKVIVLADQYDGLNAVASQIKTLIGEYNSIASDLTSQLSSVSGEVTTLNTVITEFSEFVNSSVTTINGEIAGLTSKISTLTIKVDDLVAKVDNTSETIYSIKGMVDIQLQDAITVINNATLVAENVATKAASADTSIEECLGILGVAKTDTDLIFSNLTAYKDEVGQIYSETMAHISSVESSLVVLDSKATTITEQLNSALDVTTAISSHVDDVKTHVDEVASTIETVYLKKVDQAVDSALLSGKAIDYFLHDDNSETKLSTSPTIQQMQTAIGNINDVIQSDTGTLDTLQEIVDFIKLNKATLDSLNIDNIAGLQTALDGKLATDANAVSASKWEVARKITLGGALSGFVDLDGSADATLNATIVDMAAVPSLVDALAAKLDKTGVAADSTMFDGIAASRFFFGDDASNVKAILASGMDELTQSGFYKTTDTNMSIIHMQRDADNAMRIWWDPDLNYLYYKYKADGNWTSTNFRILSQDSRLDFNKLDNVPVFAPDVHTHLWADITDKPTTFTPGVHSHYWDDILSKPTTFLAAPHDHYSVVSEGLLAEVSGTESITYPGVSMVEAKASNKYVVGTKEGTVLNLKGDAQSQLMVSGNSGAKPSLLIRSKGYGVDEIWSEWAKVFSSQDAPTWSDIASKPTTLAGFGITDGAPSTHVGATGAAHGVATTSVDGFMSAADKVKLNGVATGANLYVHPTGDGNLHVPSNSGVAVGACLAAGATAGVLSWVSAIWRSYGVTQIAKTAANNSTYIGQYTKFLTVTLNSQYQDYTAEVTAMSAGNGNLNNQNSRLNLRIKQQSAFGTDPLIEVFQTQLTTVDKQRYFYSIVQNTPNTIVDFYVMNVESWNQINFFIQNDLLNGGSAAYLSNQAYSTTLPANAVEFSKNRLLTESYHPLADALTTARTLSWTGDATGSFAFSGAANASTALTLSATGVAAGTYRSVTVDAKGRVTWGTNPTTLAGYGITDAAPSSHVGSTGTAHGVATTSVAGFMSAADKTKLDGLGSGGVATTADKLTTPRLINGTSFDGTSNISTANWGTGRSITIGDVSKTVDGSSNVSWSTSELGFLPTSGGTMTGVLTLYGSELRVSQGIGSGNHFHVLMDDGIATIATQFGTSGFKVRTGDSGAKFLVDESGELYANGIYRVYHTNNKPTATDVGLGLVDNTSDLDKPVSTATQTALNTKAPSSHVGSTGTTHGVATTTVAGFMSSSDKTKLDGIAAGANVYTHPNSGVTAGTYKSVTVNAQGHITSGTNPTTLAGYGITDAAAASHTHSYLPTSGGTINGNLAISGIASGTGGLLSNNGRTMIRGSEITTIVIGNTTDSVLMAGNSLTAWKVRYGSTEYNLYHTGNKPTPAEIGAQPATSDIMVKSNIVSLPPVLDKIMLIDPKTFTMEGREGTCVGTIAQDWEVDFPEVILNVPSTAQGEPEMLKGIDALGTIGILLKAIQELKGEIEELKNR